LPAKALRDQIFRAASNDEFLRSRAECGNAKRFVVDAENGLGVIDCNLRANRGRRTIFQCRAEMRHQFRTFENDKTVVECISFVGFGKARSESSAFALWKRGNVKRFQMVAFKGSRPRPAAAGLRRGRRPSPEFLRGRPLAARRRFSVSAMEKPQMIRQLPKYRTPKAPGCHGIVLLLVIAIASLASVGSEVFVLQ
jgi:hypothetical protein